MLNYPSVNPLTVVPNDGQYGPCHICGYLFAWDGLPMGKSTNHVDQIQDQLGLV